MTINDTKQQIAGMSKENSNSKNLFTIYENPAKNIESKCVAKKLGPYSH